MSFRIRISAAAVRDIEQVLGHTLREFGLLQYEEYKDLIRTALADVSANPNRLSARRRAELHPHARTFHIARPGRHARHFLLYRIIGDYVDVGRLLHDSMDLRRHLPKGYAARDN
jgi:toxin ParE1/3/4